ncbi:MAG: alpha/beta hydrolase [Planctomycetota bacterium]|nr:alpha/beta hydrolase [Planctomycetota bacterium]
MPQRLDPVFLWPEGAPGALGDGSEDRPRLTPYLLEGPGPHACVIVCPGGGYQTRAQHERDPISIWLNQAGVSSFVLDYRVKPYQHPVPLLDAQRAIRTVRARAQEWRLDPQRIGILGFSAGGHLASSASTFHDEGIPDAKDPIDRQSCRPDALVACYAVITFDETYGHRGCRTNFLGETPDPALVKRVSLENSVTSRNPPAFIWHTTDDPVVPVENALVFGIALRKAGVPYELHSFPHGRHGLGLAGDDPTVGAWTGLCERWLKNIGFVK